MKPQRPRLADLNPPLGYPGGPCHLMDRIEEEVRNPRLREDMVEDIETGEELSDAEVRELFPYREFPGVKGTRFRQIALTPHAQYRMDWKGISLADVRYALLQLHERWAREKSQQTPWYKDLQSDLEWGRTVEWQTKTGLKVVFQPTPAKRGFGVRVITVIWKGLPNPRPKQREECGVFEGWSDMVKRVASRYASLGDCYHANGRYFMDKGLFGGPGMKLVHGEVTGQGKLAGVRYGHCWIEDGNTVIDVSNGRAIRMPRQAYYALGRIDENANVHKYDFREFQEKILQHEHWGPWDLKTSTGL